MTAKRTLAGIDLLGLGQRPGIAADMTRILSLLAALGISACQLDSALELPGGSETWITVPGHEIGNLPEGSSAFSRIADVRVGQGGEAIHVLDSGDDRLTVWSPEGSLLLEAGGQEEGPVEFRSPDQVRAREEGFYVRDGSGFEVFSADGSHLQTVSVPMSVDFRRFRLRPELMLDDGGFVVSPRLSARDRTGWSGEDPILDVPVLRLEQRDDQWALDTLVVIDIRNRDLDIRPPGGGSSWSVSARQPYGDADEVHFNTRANTVVVTRESHVDAGAVDVNEISASGDTVWSRRLRFAPIPLLPSDVEEAVESQALALSGAMEAVSPAEARAMVRDALYAPDHHPAVVTAEAMSTNELWLKTYEEADADTLDVWYAVRIGDDDAHLRRILLPKNFYPLDATDSHVWGVRYDPSGQYVEGRSLVRDARVVRLEVDERAPFAGGHSFARTGPYEKIVGRLYIEVDPSDPANARVSDLKLAPMNDRGRVEVWTDFFLLKPADPGRGNGRLLYDVANRGNKVALGSFNGGGGNDPTTLEHAGDGFLMEEGYSILWSGWSGDVEPGNDRVQIGVPIARNEDGSSIVGRIYAEIEATVYGLYVANVLESGSDAATRRFHSLPFDWGSSRPYPSVTTDNAGATLVKRPHRDAEEVEIPRDQWRFGRMEDGGVVVADPNRVYVAGGFEPGWLYDLVYEGKDPRVTGLGLAATRDVISFFRYASDEEGPRANPLAGTIEYAYGYGGSQSGRFLHHFVYEGFNADPEGRLVLDAIMPHVAGAGKGIFNHRFGQTTRHGSHHEEKLYPSDFFPFNSVHQSDPVTGASGSMLDRAHASGHVPRVFFTQTSTEYWSRAASLLHTDVEGTVDAELDPSVRIYMIAGTAHNSMTGGVYQSPVNRATTRPVLRALLVALDRWVAEGAEPPRSRYPRIDDGTLVDLTAFRAVWPEIPGAGAPEDYYQPFRLDPGPRWATEGIADHVPPEIGPAFQTLVPMINADGNEVAGIRLPHVAVPLATYTGWNLRDASWGAGGMLTRWMGSYLTFPRTPAEGSSLRDPRRSVQERYRTHDAYVAEVERVCRELVAGGYLLERDAEMLIREAAALTW